MTDTASRLLGTIRRVIGPEVSVDIKSSVEDLKVDSLGFFELRMSIEEEFGIEFRTEEFIRSGSIRDLLEMIQSKVDADTDSSTAEPKPRD